MHGENFDSLCGFGGLDLKLRVSWTTRLTSAADREGVKCQTPRLTAC